MITPRMKKLHLIGLGMSNSTGGVNITAPIFVVSGNPDLQANCSKAAGKIVLFNTIFTTYGNTVSTRTNAAIWGESCGAVAALIRSIGPFSMQVTLYRSPSLILLTYLESSHWIFNHRIHSCSCSMFFLPPLSFDPLQISLEDASQLQRMQDRGQEVLVSLYMESTLYPDSPSRNLLIDLVGTEKPDEYGNILSLTHTHLFLSAGEWSW